MPKNRIQNKTKREKSHYPNMYQNGKVRKDTNGKKTAVRTMTGISKADRIAIPDLRIGREWYIRIEFGYVDLYFIGGSIRVRDDIPSARIRVGRIVSGAFQPSDLLSEDTWRAIALRMYPKTGASVDQAERAIKRAVLKHYQERYPSALPHILAIRKR